MAYRSLYRQLRPQRFGDMVGQDHITQVLQNAIYNKKLSHAYLFSGPHGTGKTTISRIIAKAANCDHLQDKEPCLSCSKCVDIMSGKSMDVLEIDAASHRGIDEMRELRDKVDYVPVNARFKIYIIDEVHMLTQEAFNALLKTLEEPPAHACFILATTEPYRLPVTVISRCQHFAFRPISNKVMAAYLIDICRLHNMDSDPLAIDLLVRSASGSLRDALSILEQVFVSEDSYLSQDVVCRLTGNVIHENLISLWKAWVDKDRFNIINIVKVMTEGGYSADIILQELITYAHNHFSGDDYLSEKSQTKDAQDFFLRIEFLLKSLVDLKKSPLPQIFLEVLLLRDCVNIHNVHVEQGSSVVDLDAIFQDKFTKLADRVGNLETVFDHNKPLYQDNNREILTSISSNAFVVSDDWFYKSSESDLQKVKGKWLSILELIKANSVRLHAWFVNGEPVSIADNNLVVAFTSKIHCMTVNKDVNRERIEKIINGILNKEYFFRPVLAAIWKKYLSDMHTSERVKEKKQSLNNMEISFFRALSIFGNGLVQWTD